MVRLGFVRSQEDDRCPFSEISIKKFSKVGVEVWIDEAFKGSSVFDLSTEDIIKPENEILEKCDIVYKNTPFSDDQLDGLSSEAVLVSFYAPFNPENSMPTLDKIQNSVFSMDMIPRTTLAQSMDVLSSMASLSGYKAVLLAALKLPRYFPMMMTAAGTIKPSNVLIIGAGVAGLQAIATARKLGAKVEAFDVRPQVKDEVNSLGAKFVEVVGSTDDSSAGGYAVEQTDDYKERQKMAIHESVKKANVVITTAQLRGRIAPILITKEMVEDMKTGSVIIDMASSSGGNCEVSKDQEEINYKGVTIIGDSVLYMRGLNDASTLLSNNIYNYISTFIKDEKVLLDMENEIILKSKVHPKT